MAGFSHDPFNDSSEQNIGDNYSFDPTHPAQMRSFSGKENPPPDSCSFISGSRHPTLSDIDLFAGEPSHGSLVLPKTIPLVNQDSENKLSRRAVYGRDLVFQSPQRSSHIAVFGPTGSGKNTSVIDPLRFSAITDSNHTLINFSLKASDFGPISMLCKEVGKKLIVVNLNDAWRSTKWNPLDTDDPDAAISYIRRFADSVKNPLSSDSEFWTQWIKTAMIGAWQAGHRSFPAIYKLFSRPSADLIKALLAHGNSSSRQLAEFLDGGSSNANTVQASIVGSMVCFISKNVSRAMSDDELDIRNIFKEPVCLHVEIPETSLETHRVLYKMLAKSVTDALIDTAETSVGSPIPATVFFDDMPSLGCILTPERMLTMRSREIGIVGGIQSMSSLELAYGRTSRALIDNFHTKIILPGGPTDDAEYFSHSGGEQIVGLPIREGQQPMLVTRPLISATEIRTPDYHHPLFGTPATLISGATTFQAYLQRTYEHPWMVSLLRRASGISGRERLRSWDIYIDVTDP
ncbi:MAG: type IV secretory system conjugative DNA transfer family protein [Pirellulaceae bacterium]|nr:type IV secretory system conjugative DNA transfer family protein [Pirellulaceae bacterium]